MDHKKLCAGLISAVMTAGMLSFFPALEPVLYAESEFVSDDFEVNYDGWTNKGDLTQLTAYDYIGHNNSRGMQVTNRQAESDGAYSQKGLYLDGENEYNYSVFVRHDENANEKFHLTLTYLNSDGKTYGTKELASKSVNPGEWTELSASYATPDGTADLTLSITTDSTADFTFDDVLITGQNKVSTSSVNAADSTVGLKDMYANYFRVGSVLNSGTVKNSTITALVLREFNSITFENELKPDGTMSQSTSSGTNVGVSLSGAASLLNFCAQNKIAVRGHTLVWHSQTPQWVFKENFNANNNWVSESVMDQRMESYIKNMFSALTTQYPSLNLYAYDVCNECVSDDSTRTANYGGARVPGYGNGQSPWVQVYGDNGFVERAFTFARKYAPSTCKLFYNDYNEYWDHKRDCIATMCTSLYNKGLLDGIGMQSHIGCEISGFTGVSTYTTALQKFANIGCNVQITELDVSTNKGAYTASQQADKYKAIFQAAVNLNKTSTKGKVTAVCIWGPNDANTWLGSENTPLLFDSNSQPKAAYTSVASIIPQSEWGDGDNIGGSTPVTPIEPDENGYYFHSTYESSTDNWSSRGDAVLAQNSTNFYAGSKSLNVSGRTSTWNGASYSLNSAAFKPGSSYSFSAMVMQNSNSSENMKFTLQYDDSTGTTQYAQIAAAVAANGVWVQLANKSFTIPSDATNCYIYVESVDNTIDFYVDEAIGAVDGTVISGPSIGSNMRGDINNDGSINIIDLSLIKLMILYNKVDAAAKTRADIDGSGTVDVKDLQYLNKYILKKIDKFPEITSPVDWTKMNSLFSTITPAKSYKSATNNNPLYTQRFGADPGIMEYNGRVYVYLTNDALEYNTDGSIKENSYAVKTLDCLSSDDMVNWTDHGIINVAGSGAAASWAGNSWAPTACHKTINGKEKFFIYFANNANGIGVLSSDSPTGPWVDPIGKALVSRSTSNCSSVTWLFDPAVLVDSDGTGYLYFGGGVPDGQQANPKTSRVVKLGSDMISLDGTPQTIDAPYIFEDSGINKIGSTYYYSYCTNWNTGGNTLGLSNAVICYMTSSSPMGPFTYKGQMFGNPGGGDFGAYNNNHHTMVQFKNNYYLFYHTRAVDHAMGLEKLYRSPQVDKATVGTDGKISVTATMAGVSAVQTLNPYLTVQAETIHEQGGISVNNVGNSGNTVVAAKTGNWIGVKNVAFTNGATSVTAKVTSTAGGAIKVCTGSATGTAVGYIEIPAGSSSKDITSVISGLTGTQNLYFVFSGDIQMDSWSFK